jgi:hypothetical protein
MNRTEVISLQIAFAIQCQIMPRLELMNIVVKKANENLGKLNEALNRINIIGLLTED